MSTLKAGGFLGSILSLAMVAACNADSPSGEPWERDAGPEGVQPVDAMDAGQSVAEDAAVSADAAVRAESDAGPAQDGAASAEDASVESPEPPEPFACITTSDCPSEMCCATSGSCAMPNGAWHTLSPLPDGLTLAGHIAVYDSVHGRILVHGGFTGSDGSGAVYALDVRPGSSSTWRRIEVEGTAPRRSYHAGIFDDVSDPPRLVVYGGFADRAPDSVWSLEFPVGATPRWVEIIPEDDEFAPEGEEAPKARSHHSAVFDSHRRAMIVYGGETPARGTFDDLWALSLDDSAPRWHAISPAGIDPFGYGRKYHSAVYDEANQRMIVFGGYDGTFTLNDVISLELAGASGPAWYDVEVSSAPPQLLYHRAAYDGLNQQMVVFGGMDNVTGRGTNDLWLVSLSVSGPAEWWRMSLGDTTPATRWTHSLAFDPLQQRAIVTGGFDGSTGRGDTWAASTALCSSLEPE